MYAIRSYYGLCFSTCSTCSPTSNKHYKTSYIYAHMHDDDNDDYELENMINISNNNYKKNRSSSKNINWSFQDHCPFVRCGDVRNNFV